MRLASVAILSSGLLLGALPVSAEHADYRYDVKGRASLRLVTDDGHVRVRPGPKGRITIELTTVGWDIGGTGGLRVTESQEGNDVSFEVREPRIRWFNISPPRRIELDVVVPPELDLEVMTGDGAVVLGALSGRLTVRTGDGDVEASGLRGDLALGTGDGTIIAAGLDGRLRGSSGDGRIIASGRFDLLQVTTGDGRVEVSAAEGSKVAEEWRVTSGDGPVVLRVPGDLRAELDASTGDGRISTDLPLQIRGRLTGRSLRGSLNGGGGRIVLRTGDGSIHIAAAE